MKLKYTDGCICTSLTVDGKETTDMTFDELRAVVLNMFKHIWDNKSDVIPDIITDLIREVGMNKSFKYGKYDIFDEIGIYMYYYNDDCKDYLTYIEVPYNETLYVNELVCDYTKLVRQFKWDNNLHCNDKYFDIVKTMLERVEDFAVLQRLFCEILEQCGIPKSLGRCECCDDYINTYSMTI